MGRRKKGKKRSKYTSGNKERKTLLSALARLRREPEYRERRAFFLCQMVNSSQNMITIGGWFGRVPTRGGVARSWVLFAWLVVPALPTPVWTPMSFCLLKRDESLDCFRTSSSLLN